MRAVRCSMTKLRQPCGGAGRATAQTCPARMVANLLFSDMPSVYFQTCIAFCFVCLFHFNIFLMNTTCKKGKKTKNKYLNILLNITKNDLGTTLLY